MSAPQLPAEIQVLERGWLSANCILAFDGGEATLIDSGYVTHAAQTLALVEHALAGRRLTRLYNTHVHSDHMGGNAALQARHGCEIHIPAGHAERVTAWDESALLLAPLGQQAAPFRHDGAVMPGDRPVFAEREWQVLAVPGHDMEAVAYFQPESGLLLSGDALWQDGFGVVFPELIAEPGGFAATRATLDLLARLPLRTVVPGHGAAFADVDAALQRAYARLDYLSGAPERLARLALKVIFVFHLLEKRRLPRATLAAHLQGLSFVAEVNQRFLGLPPGALADWLTAELARAGVLRLEDDWVLAA
ncbi:MAG: hypothetical protein RIR00_2400 [Pseudomonadota bacterium]|jgi:glyoxylase-like metal-dependent hydrolase (beta-lactamase superfamily II)